MPKYPFPPFNACYSEASDYGTYYISYKEPKYNEKDGKRVFTWLRRLQGQMQWETINSFGFNPIRSILPALKLTYVEQF